MTDFPLKIIVLVGLKLQPRVQTTVSLLWQLGDKQCCQFPVTADMKQSKPGRLLLIYFMLISQQHSTNSMFTSGSGYTDIGVY